MTLNPQLPNPESPAGQEALHELDRNQPLGNGQLGPQGGDRLTGSSQFFLCDGASATVSILR